MKVSKDVYRQMNKGYNQIFDGLQEIEDIDVEVSRAVNYALNILDSALDEIKASVVEDEASGEGRKPEINGFHLV